MKQTPEAALNQVLEKLSALHPKKIDLSLGRMKRLLRSLGNPEQTLPPIIHVAGTNGKGSVIAYLRSIFEASGLKVHVYTSPHLVSFRERIRLAGNLISEDHLIRVLEKVEKANKAKPITFFEVTTAAAFQAFSETKADVLLLEVGLGGRLDATNVIKPMLSLITPIGLDHAEFLGSDIEKIAWEKAGIMKPGVEVVTSPQSEKVFKVLEKEAKKLGCHLTLTTPNRPLPEISLKGPHQTDNALTALTAVKVQKKFGISEGAILKGLKNAQWPARLQPIPPETLTLGKGVEVYLDGGHNPMAGVALGEFLKTASGTTKKAIVGMMANKDIRGFLDPLKSEVDEIFAVPIPNQENGADPKTILKAAKNLTLKGQEFSTLETALSEIRSHPPDFLLIAGSLYLAGAVLEMAGLAPK